jgi:hypothetical protein
MSSRDTSFVVLPTQAQNHSLLSAFPQQPSRRSSRYQESGPQARPLWTAVKEILTADSTFCVTCLQVSRLCSPAERWPAKQPDDDHDMHDRISSDLQTVPQTQSEGPPGGRQQGCHMSLGQALW